MANKSLKKYFLVGTKSRLLNSLYETYLIQNEILKFGRNDLEIDQMIKLIKKCNEEFMEANIFWCSGSSRPRSEDFKVKKDLENLKMFLAKLSSISKPNIRLIFFSSGGTVYGQNAGVVNESSELNPQSFYAEMKINCEYELRKFQESTGNGLVIFRLANVYSENLDAGSKGLIESLIVSAKNNTKFNYFVEKNSLKQYGQYQDYAIYIKLFLEQNFEFFVIRNICPTHLYTVEKIKEHIETFYNLKIKAHSILGSPEETVILTNNNLANTNNFSWRSLHDFLNELNK